MTMYGLQARIESSMEDILIEKGYLDDSASLQSEMSGVLQCAIEGVAVSVTNSIVNDFESLESRRKEIAGFEERLRKLWSEPLNLLDVFVAVSVEIGMEFSSLHAVDAAKSGDSVFSALTRLHARACQVSSAILVLLVVSLKVV